MRSRKTVPRNFKDKPNIDAFLRMEESTRQGKGKPQKPKPLHRRHRNKHGRQHG